MAAALNHLQLSLSLINFQLFLNFTTTSTPILSFPHDQLRYLQHMPHIIVKVSDPICRDIFHLKTDSFTGNPQNTNMPQSPWTDATERKMLLTIIHLTAPQLPKWEKVQELMGEDFTANAIR